MNAVKGGRLRVAPRAAEACSYPTWAKPKAQNQNDEGPGGAGGARTLGPDHGVPHAQRDGVLGAWGEKKHGASKEEVLLLVPEKCSKQAGGADGRRPLLEEEEGAAHCKKGGTGGEVAP